MKRTYIWEGQKIELDDIQITTEFVKFKYLNKFYEYNILERGKTRFFLQTKEETIDGRGVFIGKKKHVWAGKNESFFEEQHVGENHEEAHGAVSPLPGKILKINVKNGDSVKKGQLLATLEAMKMEYPLEAPFEGTVSGIHSAEGELVEQGIEIVTIEEKS